jgi:phage-related protein
MYSRSHWELVYYTDSEGRCPVEEFIDTQGIHLHRPYADLLEDGIHELRTKVSKLRYRVLYFFWQGNRIVITHGITKTTKRIPPREIGRAKAYRDDWLARHRSNT